MNDEVPVDRGERLAVSRAVLVRDIAALQVKLLVDGFRDLLLVPASLIVGLVSLLKGGSDVGSEFYDLLRLGRRSERWINLFGAVDRLAAESAGDDGLQAGGGASGGEDIDTLVERVEAFVVEEYRHGRVSGQARERLERAVGRLRQRAGGQRGGPPAD